MSEKTINKDLFKNETIKDIILCFENAKKSKLRFSEIKKGLPFKKVTEPKIKKERKIERPKHFDQTIVRALDKMVSFGIFNKTERYYQLTDKYMVEFRKMQLSRMVESYSPKDLLDYSKTVLLGLPHEVYYPNKYEVASEYFHDLYITPEDIFKDDSDFMKRIKERMKETIIKSIDDDYKNKTKEELIEALKKSELSQCNQVFFKHRIPPYEACDLIVRKLVEGRDKYRLLLIQNEYDTQLLHIIDNDFKQHLYDYQRYYTQKLNIYFMHFFKFGRHSLEDRYKDFDSREDFEDTLFLFFNVDDNQLQTDIVRPPSESVLRWGIEILKFLSTIVQNVNEQTNDRYITPITIVSTSFRAVFADKEFWENDEKIKKIIKENNRRIPASSN